MSDEIMQQTSQKVSQLLFTLPQIMSLKEQIKAKKEVKAENAMAQERFAVGEKFFEGKPFVFTGSEADLCFFYAEKAMPVNCIKEIKNDALRKKVVESIKDLQQKGYVEIRNAGGQDAVFLTKQGHEYIMPQYSTFWNGAKDAQADALKNMNPEGVEIHQVKINPKYIKTPKDIVNIVGTLTEESNGKASLTDICKQFDRKTADSFLFRCYKAKEQGLVEIDSKGGAVLTEKGQQLYAQIGESQTCVTTSYQVGTVISDNTFNYSDAPVSDETKNMWNNWLSKISKEDAKIVKIPSWATEIPPCAMCDTSVEMVVVPESVMNISCGAFYGCENLKAVSLPDTLVSIEDGAFAHTGLEEITIPQNVEYVGKDAFEGCINLDKAVVSTDKCEVSVSEHFSECKSSLTITQSAPVASTQVSAQVASQATTQAVTEATTQVASQATVQVADAVADSALMSAPTGITQVAVVAKKAVTCVLNMIPKAKKATLSNAHVQVRTLDKE